MVPTVFDLPLSPITIMMGPKVSRAGTSVFVDVFPYSDCVGKSDSVRTKYSLRTSINLPVWRGIVFI